MRVMRAIREDEMSIVDAVRTFGVSRQSIYNWKEALKHGGEERLRARKRGRPPGTQLLPLQAALTVRLITDHCPDQLKFPFALWTREAVQGLLARRFDLHVSVWTVGRYLKHWGFTPQKPTRRAYEKNPAAVKRWLRKEYPAIHRKAKTEGAEIFWEDQMGLRSDHQTGTTYGRKGVTPAIPGTGQRFSCSMLSAINNRGKMLFRVLKERFTCDVQIDFMERMLRQLPGKVFLILDRHPVHRSRCVTQWAAEQRDRIRLFFLPAYSPELNPDEFLNQDVKSNALGRRRPETRTEMISGLRSYLWSTQRRPVAVKNFFHAKSVRYAAAM